MTKKIVHSSGVVSAFVFFCSCTVSKSDLYQDRLVYLKKDSSLFSGTLEIRNTSSYTKKDFCEGVPCGEWSERGRDGEFIMGGKYVSPDDVFSDTSRLLLKGDTLTVCYWREGDLPFVTVTILKPDGFFIDSYEKTRSDYTSRIAVAIGTDLNIKGYDYNTLHIVFLNAYLDDTKYLSKSYRVQFGEANEVK